MKSLCQKKETSGRVGHLLRWLGVVPSVKSTHAMKPPEVASLLAIQKHKQKAASGRLNGCV